MNHLKKVKIEHILRLSEWKKSGSKIWSRWVPHHLYPYEKIKLEKALKNKYLEINSKDRENLQNIWEKICINQNWENYIIYSVHGTKWAKLLLNYREIDSWNKNFLKGKITNFL